MQNLLTSAEVCRYFRIAPVTLWRWRKDRKLAALKTPGGKLRFRKHDVSRVLRDEATGLPKDLQ